jgi:hypothetical protein
MTACDATGRCRPRGKHRDFAKPRADRSDADETMRADAARYDGIGETFV